MRSCVVLAVLLSLVLSFSQGNNDTTPETASTMPGSEGNNDTSPETTALTTRGSEGNNDTTPETASTMPGSEGNNDTSPVTTALTTPGSEGNSNTTPETTASTTPGSEGNNDTTPETASTMPGSEGNNDTSPVTTALTTPGSEGNNDTTPETASTMPGSEGNNDTSPVTTALTTPGSEGNSNTTPETTASTTPGSEGNSNTTPETTASTTPGSEGNNDTTPETASTMPGSEGNNDTSPVTTALTTPGSEGNNGITLETMPSATSGSTTENNNATTPETTASTTPGSAGMHPTSPSAITPATRDFCDKDPCGKKFARCVALNSTFTCQCQYGFYYSNENCHAGKIYPGVITLKRSYSSSVQIVNSLEYEEVFKNITMLFKDAFKGIEGFAETVIVEIQQIQRESRASSPLTVMVTNLFMDNSNVTNETVTDAIRAEIDKSNYVSEYRGTTYCAVFKCNDQTTYCKEAVHPECICKDDFTKTEWDERSCSDCSENCSSKQNKYCERVGVVPTCKCMANFEKKNDNCVPCPVGYSGENCKDNTELSLIIVGTVLGAIILSLLIAVSIVAVRKKHTQDPEQKRLIKSGYSESNTYADTQTRMFPRVQTTSGHVNPGYQPNNPYEMHSTNRGQFPERDYDDLYDISQGHEGFRMQSKY